MWNLGGRFNHFRRAGSGLSPSGGCSLPGAAFTFFPCINPSLYNSGCQLMLCRLPCPSAPSERPEASSHYQDDATLVQPLFPTLKTQKSGTEQSPALLSQRKLTQTPSPAAACDSSPKQQAKPPPTCTPTPSRAALISLLPPQG